METKWIKDLEHTWNEEAIRQAGQIIRDGGLVAFPTETVYGLGGDALNPDSSRKIYAAKGRPSDNPLIVHICRLEDLSKIAAEIPENAKKLAEKFRINTRFASVALCITSSIAASLSFAS